MTNTNKKVKRVILVDDNIKRAQIAYFLKHTKEGRKALEKYDYGNEDNFSIKVINKNFFSNIPKLNEKENNFSISIPPSALAKSNDLLSVSLNKQPDEEVEYISFLPSTYENVEDLFLYIDKKTTSNNRTKTNEEKPDKIYQVLDPSVGNNLCLYRNLCEKEWKDFELKNPSSDDILKSTLKRELFSKSSDFFSQVLTDKDLSNSVSKYIASLDPTLSGKERILTEAEFNFLNQDHEMAYKVLLFLDLVVKNNNYKEVEKEFNFPLDFYAEVKVKGLDVTSGPKTMLAKLNPLSFPKITDDFALLKDSVAEFNYRLERGLPVDEHPITKALIPDYVPENFSFKLDDKVCYPIFNDTTRKWKLFYKNDTGNLILWEPKDYTPISSLDMASLYEAFRISHQFYLNMKVKNASFESNIKILDDKARSPEAHLFTEATLTNFFETEILNNDETEKAFKKFKNFDPLKSLTTPQDFFELLHSLGWISNPKTFSSDFPSDLLDTSSNFYKNIQEANFIPDHIIPAEDYSCISPNSSHGIFPHFFVSSQTGFKDFLKKEHAAVADIYKNYVSNHAEDFLQEFKKELIKKNPNIDKEELDSLKSLNIATAGLLYKEAWQEFRDKKVKKEVPLLYQKLKWLNNFLSDTAAFDIIFSTMKGITDKVKNASLNAQWVKRVNVNLMHKDENTNFNIELTVPNSNKQNKITNQDIFSNYSLSENSSVVQLDTYSNFQDTDIFREHGRFAPYYKKDDIAQIFSSLFVNEPNAYYDAYKEIVNKAREYGWISTTKNFDINNPNAELNLNQGYQLTSTGKRVFNVLNSISKNVNKTNSVVDTLEENLSSNSFDCFVDNHFYKIEDGLIMQDGDCIDNPNSNDKKFNAAAILEASQKSEKERFNDMKIENIFSFNNFEELQSKSISKTIEQSSTISEKYKNFITNLKSKFNITHQAKKIFSTHIAPKSKPTAKKAEEKLLKTFETKSQNNNEQIDSFLEQFEAAPVDDSFQIEDKWFWKTSSGDIFVAHGYGDNVDWEKIGNINEDSVKKIKKVFSTNM